MIGQINYYFRKNFLLVTILLVFGFYLPKSALGNTSKSKKQYLEVTADRLNMRVGAGTRHGIIKVLRKGMYLSLTHTTKRGWILVQDWDGTRGWVFKKYTKKIQEKSLDIALKSTEDGVDSSKLEKAIQGYIRDLKKKGWMYRADNLSLVIEDFHTGEVVASVNPTAQVKAASLIKVPILHAYMLQKYRKKIKHTKSNQRHLVRMIRYSDNKSTNRILRILGGPWAVRRILQKTGVYRHVKLVEYIPADGRTYLNKISAEDLNRLFSRLWDREILGKTFDSKSNKKASEQMLYILGLSSSSRARDRLKDGTCFASDRSAKIWDKTGYVRGLNGDVGIIEIDTKQGRRSYSVISIIDRPNYKTIRGNSDRWARKQSRLHRRISEMTYAFFKERYGSKTQCGRQRLLRYY